MKRHIIALAIILTAAPLNAALGEEAPSFPPESAAPEAAVSPKAPWPDISTKLPAEMKEESTPWWEHVLLWVPNRIADFIDIFRIDLGVGPAVGGVVRITEFGQVGYRMMMPASLRVGDFGRKVPVMVEHSNEFGVGPLYVSSSERKVCTGEVGAGLDLLILGGYGGVCFEEVADFVGGLFFLDLMKDDWK